MPAFTFSDTTKNAFGELGKNISDTVNSFLDTIAGTDVSALYNTEFTNALNKLQTTIEQMEKAATENTKEVKELLEAYRKGKLSLVNESFKGASKGFNNAASNINGILGNADSNAIQKIRDKMKSLNEQFDITGKTVEKLSEELKTAETVEQINSIFDSIKNNINNISGFTASMNGLEKDSIKAKNAFDLMEGSLKSIGQIGEIVEAIITKNWIGMLITLIARLASTFSNISTHAAAAENILDVLFDIIESFISDLGESLDSIFRPLLDINSALGRVIGQILRTLVMLLEPLFKLISKFDILAPILNIVSLLIAGITDAFAYMFNFVSDIIKKITFDLIDLGHMKTDSYSKALDSISQENSYEDYQNNSTSYSVSGDMYINIYYEHSFVNGDAQQICIAIRDEIRRAEKAGY
jgi:archaellum component FlaC